MWVCTVYTNAKKLAPLSFNATTQWQYITFVDLWYCNKQLLNCYMGVSFCMQCIFQHLFTYLSSSCLLLFFGDWTKCRKGPPRQCKADGEPSPVLLELTPLDSTGAERRFAQKCLKGGKRCRKTTTVRYSAAQKGSLNLFSSSHCFSFNFNKQMLNGNIIWIFMVLWCYYEYIFIIL